MPAQTAFSRLGKSDFFPIMASGIYVTASYSLYFVAWLHNDGTHSARETLSRCASIFERHWTVAFGFFSIAFLVGHALRAVRVSRPDAWWSVFASPFRSMKWIETRPYDQIIFNGKFPYREMIENDLFELNRHVPKVQLDMPPVGAEHTAFNFWKMRLCQQGGGAFDYTQDQESRVRLFATMFMAGCLSLLPSGMGLLFSAFHPLDPGWNWVMFLILAFSLLICGMFGSQIRRVRAHEVGCLFLAYVALLTAESQAAKNAPKEAVESRTESGLGESR